MPKNRPIGLSKSSFQRRSFPMIRRTIARTPTINISPNSRIPAPFHPTWLSIELHFCILEAFAGFHLGQKYPAVIFAESSSRARECLFAPAEHCLGKRGFRSRGSSDRTLKILAD